MSHGSRPAQARKQNPIGLQPAARPLERLARHHRDKRLDVHGWIEHCRGIAIHYAWAWPGHAARGIWRRTDWLGVPIVCVGFAIFGVSWWLTAPVALGAIAYRAALTRRTLPPPIARQVAERDRLRTQRKFNKVRPRPAIKSITRHGHKTTIEGSLPVGITENEFNGVVPQLATIFDEEVRIDFPTPTRFLLHVCHRDVLAPEPARPELDDVLMDIGAGNIPIGIGANEQIIWWQPVGHHLIWAGMTGAGKSTSFNSVLDYERQLPFREFHVYAAKGLRDFGWFKDEAAWMSESIPETADHLEQLLATLKARSNALPPGPYRPSARFPIVFVCLDEYKTLTSSTLPKTLKDRLVGSLAEILRLGRDPGFVVQAASQDLHKNVIASELLGQLTHRIGLRVADSGQSTAITGSQSPRWDLSTISADQPGRGLFIGAVPHFQPIRTFRHLNPQPVPSDLPIPVGRPLSLVPPAPRSPVHPTLIEPSQPVTGPGSNESGLSSETIREQVAARIRVSGALGVVLSTLVVELGVSKHRVQTQLDALKRDGHIEARGRRWYWIGA